MPKARIVPPLVMTYWLCEGVVISGAVVLAFPPRVFTLWGLLSGIVFVVSSCFSVTAINLIGVSAATGVWCGVAAACSFAWGVLVAGEELASVGKALLALALILAGMAGIALAAWAGGGAEIGGDGEDSRHGDAGGGARPCHGGAACVAGPLLVTQLRCTGRHGSLSFLQPRMRRA